MKAQPVFVRVSQDVGWAVSDCLRDDAPGMRARLISKHNKAGKGLCDRDMVLTNHYVRTALPLSETQQTKQRVRRPTRKRKTENENTSG